MSDDREELKTQGQVSPGAEDNHEVDGPTVLPTPIFMYPYQNFMLVSPVYFYIKVGDWGRHNYRLVDEYGGQVYSGHTDDIGELMRTEPATKHNGRGRFSFQANVGGKWTDKRYMDFDLAEKPTLTSGSLMPEMPTFSGTKDTNPKAEVQVGVDNFPQTTAVSSSPSSWTYQLDRKLDPGPHTIYVEYYVPFPDADSSHTRYSFTVVPEAALISSPKTDDVVLVRRPVVGGTGSNGTTVTVYRQGGVGGSYGSGTVANGRWKVDLTKDLPEGSFVFHAGTTFNGQHVGWSNLVPVTVKTIPDAPVITGPGAGTVQNQTFTISGTGGAAGATVEILKDQVEHTVIGTGSVKTGGTWDVTVTVPPGPISLVAEQFIGSDDHSGRSQARGFKIRPPQLTNIKEENLATPGSVKFSGTGHNGATVEITVVSGPGGTKPPDVLVSNGRWETTATNWTFGTYQLSAVQKVPDNANGWIPSQPYTFEVVRKVPSPTNVKCTVENRTPIFTGNGLNGATIVITDAVGGSVNVPVASVSTGTWSTRATAPWAPVNARSIKVVQKVGTATSDPVLISVTIENLAPPTEVAYSVTNYTPTFTGKGIVGATIYVRDAGDIDVAPPVRLTERSWSTRASTTWGPTKLRKVNVVHKQDGLTSTPVELGVTIALLAPEITGVTVDELQAEVSGRCWAGAVITLKFSDRSDLHPLSVNNGTWVFKRPTPFNPAADYTVTATQTFADLEPSPAVTQTFTIKLPTPRITGPDDKADVWRDFTVKGDKGYKGATMQLRDAQFGRALGEPKVLAEDGEWSIDLTGLDFRLYTIDAQQTLNQRPSERSQTREFNAVLVPPIITVPMENGDLPRTSTLSGWAMPGARVEVRLKDVAEPLLENIPVGYDGFWKANVTLPVGAKTIWARQTFEGRASKDSRPLNYHVVPAAPFIETPATGEHIGGRVVVSGFGVAGDSVTVRLGDVAQTVLGESPVLADRTWSVTVEFDQPGGHYPLVAVASSGEFKSADSVVRPVVLGTYRPSIDVPAQGQWVSHPVGFKGQGRPGVGQVVSWFNPDLVWAPGLPVTGGNWQGGAPQSLPRGGQWCRFRQSITDGADGATVSDWVESKRFESEPPTAES